MLSEAKQALAKKELISAVCELSVIHSDIHKLEHKLEKVLEGL